MLRDGLALVWGLPRRFAAVAAALGDARADLHELVVTSHSQEARVANVEDAITDASERLARIEGSVSRLERNVGDATDRLPNPSKGPVDKAREMVSGSGG